MPDSALTNTTTDLAAKEALALPKKGDPDTSSLTIREPEGITKEQFDENLTKTFENGSSILKNTYEKLIKSNPDRASATTNLEQSLNQLVLQGDATALANLKQQLESIRALADSDSALKAFHDTLYAILSLDKIDEKTKFGAAQNIMQEFAFIKNPAENKEKEVENIGTAFANLAQNQIFNENSIAEVLKINHDKFLTPLQEEARNTALKLSEEQKAAIQDIEPTTANPITNSSSNTNILAPKNNKTTTQKEKEQEKTEANSDDKAVGTALVGSAKYIAVGGAAITVTAFFPPIGAALLIGAAIFCAYQSMKKPIKDYQPMTDKEAEIDPEAARIAQMSSEEFMKYQMQKRDLENSRLTNYSQDLNSAQATAFKQEALAVEEQLHAAQKKLDQANAIANGAEANIEATKSTNEVGLNPLSQLLGQNPQQSENTTSPQNQVVAIGAASHSTSAADNILTALGGGQANTADASIAVNGGSGASVTSSTALDLGLGGLDESRKTAIAPAKSSIEIQDDINKSAKTTLQDTAKTKEEEKVVLQNIAGSSTLTSQQNIGGNVNPSKSWQETIKLQEEAAHNENQSRA